MSTFAQVQAVIQAALASLPEDQHADFLQAIGLLAGTEEASAKEVTIARVAALRVVDGYLAN